MKFLIGSALSVYGIYVFLGPKQALGATALWLVYVSLSFLNGDMKVKKGEIHVPDKGDAEADQLNGLG